MFAFGIVGLSCSQVNWLVSSRLIGCEIQLLFLIHGKAEEVEEQIPEWLHLCFSLSLCSCGCKVVECLEVFLSGAMV